MSVIRFPLSGSKGIQEVSLYADYADCALHNLEKEDYFEAIAVCSIGLDVLLNTLPDRILLFSADRLSQSQEDTLQLIMNGKFTAGVLVDKFKTAAVLERQLVVKLEELIKLRNIVFHPIQKGKLKEEAVYPRSASKAYATSFFKKFCRVIDLSGGRSPLEQKRQLDAYVSERRKIHRPKSLKPKGN